MEDAHPTCFDTLPVSWLLCGVSKTLKDVELNRPIFGEDLIDPTSDMHLTSSSEKQNNEAEA